MDLTTLSRTLILTALGNRLVAGAARRYGMRLGASRFIAGTTLDEAVEAVRGLNRRGIMATLDYLGESVTDTREAAHTAAAYLELLDRIHAAGVNANVSLKLTALGLAISADLALRHLRQIVDRARSLGNFVRIDMEDSPWVDATLHLYRTLRQEGYENLGVVIQAYLYRSEQDLRDLAQYGANVRLVKGAYKEPPSVAFPRKRDVDRNFKHLIRLRLESGLYTAVATHDEDAIAFTKKLVAERGIPRDRFEFQMLYGVRPALQEQLAAEGYRVRTYVPYGTHWYPYFVRRIAERPANLGFVLRNLLRP